MIKTVPCRACDAPMTWATTSSGKSMPLNAEPDPAGNVEVRVGELGLAVLEVHPPGQPPLASVGVMYMPHWATCPNADEFRK